jgi:ATPase family associated with various cellular activities (AAA)
LSICSAASCALVIEDFIAQAFRSTNAACMLHAHTAACAGANFFNLSPRNTDGKYQKKQVAMMLHMVFKVAKTMAPSVIFIDEVEKVFLSDKKKLKEFPSTEPYNRIKKDLAKVHALHALFAHCCLQAVRGFPCQLAGPMNRTSLLKLSLTCTALSIAWLSQAQ